MSYYLKYRPQKTSDLDIAAVRDFYQGILQSGTYSHAYLFSGPRGTGKTSSARILAKLLNCEENLKAIAQAKPLKEPCNNCEMCRRITRGSSLSVVEMDAASNRGIDDIRALRDKIALSPAEGAFVVYIIDEVHMLTTEAFNALLKTLEEPPKHAIFALCTTELAKLPATIVSRCTQVFFPKPTIGEVTASLEKAVGGEGLTISPEGLAMLAAAADGSFRDGMKLLEQLVQKGKKIADESVAELVQKTSQYSPSKFIRHLRAKELDGALTILRQGEEAGMDFTVFTKRLLEELREELLVAIGRNSPEAATLWRLTEMTAQALSQQKMAYIPQLPLELLASEWCLNIGSGDLGDRSQLRKPANVVEKAFQQKTVVAEAKVTEPVITVKKENSVGIQKSSASQVTASGGKITFVDLESRWNEILAKVKPLNHSLEALLRSSRPAGVNGTKVTIEVFYKFHKDRLEETKYREAIEDVMAGLFLTPIRLEFILSKSGPQKGKMAEPKTTAGEDKELVAAAEEIFG